VYKNRIFLGNDFTPFWALDRFTGDSLWKFETASWIDVLFPLIAESLTYFFSGGSLYALTCGIGALKWQKSGFNLGYHPTPSYKDNYIFFRDWQNTDIIYALNHINSAEKWHVILPDTYATSIIITLNNFLWLQTKRNIFVIDLVEGIIIYKTFFPGPYNSLGYAWFWPLIYGPYVIITHLKNMYIYKGAEFNSPQNKNYFIFYPTLIKNQGYLYLNINKGENLKIEIFDIIGRKREVFNLGYVKRGSNFYILDLKDLSQGIYILKIKDKKQKILKGGRN